MGVIKVFPSLSLMDLSKADFIVMMIGLPQARSARLRRAGKRKWGYSRVKGREDRGKEKEGRVE